MGPFKGSVSRLAAVGASVNNRNRVPARFALGTVMVEGLAARLTRLLTFLRGVTITQVLDGVPSGATQGPMETQGKSLLGALQEVMAGEGGRIWTTSQQYDALAAAPQTGPRVVFGMRDTLRPLAVKMTLDVSGDLVDSPDLERSSDGQVSVATASSRSLAATYQDSALAASIGTVAAGVSSAMNEHSELMGQAQDRVAQTRQVRLRVRGLRVDPFDATVTPSGGGPNWSRWGVLLSLQPGDRVRLTGLPSAKLGYTQLDCYVIGGEESHGGSGSPVTLTLVAADAPAELHVADDVYGRVSAPDSASLRLTAGITAGALSASLTFTGGASNGLTLDAADYPMLLDVNGECVRVASAPAGSTSPQAITLSARGLNGTVARAHSASEPVTVYLTPGVAF